ncbi:MAG TPA: S8 family serine peptidase [Candidatus Eisenbacteria bacterium]|nr:S8 family serine peptidase [Candidatus Eisenbacteria bacterium]
MKILRALRGSLLRSVLFGTILNFHFLGWAEAQHLKGHPALRHITPGSERSERFLSRGAAGEVLVDLIVVGDVAPGLLRARGIEVGTVAGRRMTARCPLGLLEALTQMPGVERVQVAERTTPHLDRSVLDARAAALHPVLDGALTGLTGSGVVVGIVDTGIDWEHPDFHRRDGRSRLLALWDQTSPVGTRPSGFTYGAYYDSTEIRMGLLDETDTAGHGTHVAGIAAGNGLATSSGLPEFTYVGVAPEADLIAVKTTFQTNAIVDGVKFIFDQAAALGKRAVVNLSLGTQDGPHDGTYDMDLMISALTGPGRIVVASAGNSGATDLHGRVPVTGSVESAMTLAVPAYVPKTGNGNDYLLFSGWYPGANRISVSLVTPTGVTVGPVARGQEREEDTPDGRVFVSNGVTSPTNGDNEIYIEIYDQSESLVPRTGTWTFRFHPVQATEAGFVDMYLHQSQLGGGALARWVQGLMKNGVIGSPGTADSVITVGAHTTRTSWTSINGSTYSFGGTTTLDALAPFSSVGPRRDGVRKPDLSAPGQGILSTKSADYAAGTNGIATDGVHVLMSGTSMSAPHVTGAVALLLARPAWSAQGPAAVRDRLRATARGDSYTGVAPNDAWGFGKLDVTTLVLGTTITAVDGGAPAPAPRFALAPNAPNPFNPSTTIRFTLATSDRTTLRIYSPGGRLIRTLVSGHLAAGPHEATWNGQDDAGRPVSSGIYLYELAAGADRRTRKMSLLK